LGGPGKLSAKSEIRRLLYLVYLQSDLLQFLHELYELSPEGGADGKVNRKLAQETLTSVDAAKTAITAVEQFPDSEDRKVLRKWLVTEQIASYVFFTEAETCALLYAGTGERAWKERSLKAFHEVDSEMAKKYGKSQELQNIVQPPEANRDNSSFVFVAIGVLIFVGILAVSLTRPDLPDTAAKSLRILMALGGAFIFAGLPGTLKVEVSKSITGSGAAGAFLLIYWFDPAGGARNARVRAKVKKNETHEKAHPDPPDRPSAPSDPPVLASRGTKAERPARGRSRERKTESEQRDARNQGR